MATKGTKAEKAAKVAAGRKAIADAVQAKNSSQLKSALLGYVGILEQTQPGLSFPGDKAAKRKVVTAFVNDAVKLRGHNITPLYVDTLTELAGKNTDAAGQFFCGAPEIYQRLSPRHVQEFVTNGLDKKLTPDYFAGASPDGQNTLHDLVEKEHREVVAERQKMGDEYRQYKVGAENRLTTAKQWGLVGTTLALIVGAVGVLAAYGHRPSSAIRDHDRARIERLKDNNDRLRAEKGYIQTKLFAAEANRDQLRAAINAQYGPRIHDAISQPEPSQSSQSVMDIVDEWLDGVGGRVRIYGPGCEAALENLHSAVGGYATDRGAFARSLRELVCPGISPQQSYVEFTK